MRRKDREITSLEKIEEIIRSCKICHIAMSRGGEPYLVPMSYGYEMAGGRLTLCLHSAREGKKLDILRQNSRVCFEISREEGLVYSNSPCGCGTLYSSVIGDGEVVFINDGDEKCEALSRLYKHQTGDEVKFTHRQADAVCVFKIISEQFTGKRRSV